MVAGHLTVKSGYWYAIVMVRDETGKKKKKWISTQLKAPGNKKKAEDILLEARRKYTMLDDMRNRNGGILFCDFLSAWVRTCHGKVSLTTYAGYKNCIDNRIVPYFAEKRIPLFELRPADILDYYDTLYAKGLSGNTVLHHHVLIRKALEEAWIRELIPSNPADKIPRPKKEKSTADCYSVEECKKLLQVIKGDPLEIPITFSMLYGLRRGEALGLRWGAVDFDRRTVTISHSVVSTSLDGKKQIIAQDKLKRKSSYRTLPLVPMVTAMLKNTATGRYGSVLPPAEDYICVDHAGKLFAPNYLSEHFKVLLARHGLRKIRYHDLRHSCANLLISSRVPLIEVQQWLGHSTISTTADLYAHLEFAAKERSAQTITQLLFTGDDSNV